MTTTSNRTYLFSSLSEKPKEWLSVKERNNFITKVYRIFIYSLLLAAMTAYFGVQMNFAFSWWWIIFELVVLVVCVRVEKSLFLLYLWTSVSGLTSAPILTNIINEGNKNIIWQAILLTIILFCILTIYVHYSKRDFSHWELILYLGLVLGLLAIIPLVMFLNNRALIVWSVIGIFLFTVYVLLDTSNILSRYRPGDEVIAAVDLHLDFTNLFWDFLRLFRGSNSGVPTENETPTDSAFNSESDISDLID